MSADGRGARRVAFGVAGLVALDVVGGTLAIAADVNTPAEAWGSKALLAAPWPMIAAQVALATATYRWRDGRGTAAAGLLSGACLVSAASGFFDGGLGNPEVPDRLEPLQWVLTVSTAAVGAVAARCALQLRASHR